MSIDWIVLKLICLAFSIFFTILTIHRVSGKNEVCWCGIGAHALSYAGFITLQWGLYL